MNDFYVAVGDTTSFSKTVSESDVYLFAGISGDFAPNHVNKAYMEKSGYGRLIAHGALLVGFMSTCSTRIAERFGATARRTEELYGLSDLDLVWPRLHAVVPEQFQATIASARADYAASARLAGWGVMYAAAASLWWPAAIVASAPFLAGRIRAKPTADRLADVVDTAVDLHLADLAEKLGAERPDDVRLLGTRVLERLRPTP